MLLSYNRDNAVAYAHRWAYDRNPAYYSYDELGGDCTNFASQVLHAGGAVMDPTPTYGWYYWDANNKAPAWTGVKYLYQFLTNSEKTCGPVGQVAELEQLQPGDLIQLSFDGQTYSHNPIVVAVSEPVTPETILLAAHTYDSDYRPLSTYAYKAIRPIHITGIKPGWKQKKQ